jgi:hypothetical protein
LADRAVAEGSTDDTTAVVLAYGVPETGSWAPLAQLVPRELPSSPAWLILGALGALLLFGALFWMVGGLLSLAAGPANGGVVVPSPTATFRSQPTPTVRQEVVEEEATQVPEPTRAPTSTPVPSPDSTSSPALEMPIGVPAQEIFCIVPSKNTQVAEDWPAKDVLRSTSIPVDTNVWVPSNSVYSDVGTTSIEIYYNDQPYHIYPWRLGRREQGMCTDIDDWRTFFSSPRTSGQ